VINSRRRKLGCAPLVPLNYRLSDDEAAYVTDHCDAGFVYVDASSRRCSNESR
jgi:acyl-CoA synthetase (AMP-forming)/AMP-acid ligase II